MKFKHALNHFFKKHKTMRKVIFALCVLSILGMSSCRTSCGCPMAELDQINPATPTISKSTLPETLDLASEDNIIL